MSGVMFDPVPHGDYDILRRALVIERLPTDDLMEVGRIFFRLSDDAGLIGYVGLEGSGADRLLRSLVVLPNRRRKGLAGSLIDHVERFARESGVARLHLLTTGAAVFFGGHGFTLADRKSAPAAIAETAQFASLCPASATYLVKDIA